MKKNKLVFVCNVDWYFSLHWLDRAISALDEFEVHVILSSTDDKYKEEIINSGLIYHSISLSRSSVSIKNEIVSFYQIYKVIKQIEPNLLHSVTIKPNVYVGLISRFLNIPLVSSFAGLGMLSTSTDIKYRIYFDILKRLIKIRSKTKGYLALFESQDDLDRLVNDSVVTSSKAVRVYGAGVDIDRYIYHPPSEVGPKIILFAARLLKDKGLSELIQAKNMLLQKGYKLELHVAGILDEGSRTGYSKAEIEKLGERGDIVWLGKRDDIPNLIQRSTLVALPTTYGEGVPRILIEAASCGRPIVTTSLGGCKDICIDNLNGNTCRPGDISSLANAIETIISNDDVAYSYGLEGRNLVLDRFTNDSIICQNNEFYRNLLS
ncbi:glycosyltransferase family 4 protein [Vibrio ezurae]|uniref:Putative glycosyltransferase n=1 Tax=Vibrio ezurae NBRC 102218 TaxID=1219080 RepID=U3CEF9_9VIBR|nr:glycosyltransferase family 4 protein [Vibrio ezurae]GAD79654.1 putative glycosyltransferase [Vibrio ezurae NBRC 102218]